MKVVFREPVVDIVNMCVCVGSHPKLLLGDTGEDGSDYQAIFRIYLNVCGTY